jgi:hypothetical protein
MFQESAAFRDRGGVGPPCLMTFLATDRSIFWTMAQNEQRRATAADHGLKLRSAAVDAGRTRRDHTPCMQV